MFDTAYGNYKRKKIFERIPAHRNFDQADRKPEFFPVAGINSSQTGMLAGLLRHIKKTLFWPEPLNLHAVVLFHSASNYTRAQVQAQINQTL